MKAEKPPKARQSRPVFGWKKLAAKIRNHRRVHDEEEPKTGAVVVHGSPLSSRPERARASRPDLERVGGAG